MTENEWLTKQFESNRGRLRSVAYRMLGSASDAEDAVQEAWIRLQNSDRPGIQNLGGWLTSVVARICLDALRTRKSHLESSDLPDRATTAPDPEQEAMLADSVGLAMLVVLETLTPAERVAFVLHDMFDLSFEEIGPIVARSPIAARQLASRARRRVRGAKTEETQTTRRQELVSAFRAASRSGDLQALLAVLAPDIVVRADPEAAKMGAEPELRGAAAVAKVFLTRAKGAQLALVDGLAGLVWAPGGRLRVVFDISVDGDKIKAIHLRANEKWIGEREVTIMDD